MEISELQLKKFSPLARGKRYKLTEEMLFNELRDFILQYGRMPVRKDFREGRLNISDTPFRNRYGTVGNGFRAFLIYLAKQPEPPHKK